MNKKLLSFLALVLLGLNGMAQEVWTNYTAPNLLTRAIAIDAQGNKWVGTDSGVRKFDGASWTTYTTANSGLTNDTISAIAIDAKGNKWIGTFKHGVCKFNDTNWTSYTVANNGLISNNINAIAIDSQGNKWIGTNGGASKFNDTAWTNYSGSGMPGYVTCITIDTQGNKWFGTFGSGIYKLGTGWTNYTTSNSGLAYNYVSAIAASHTGETIWVGYANGGNGVSYFDGTTGNGWYTYTPSLYGFNVYGTIEFITTDTSGNSWIVTNASIHKCDKYSTWTNYVYGQISMGFIPPAYSMAIDAQGNKWIGIWGGISKFDDTDWTVYPISNNSIPINKTTAVAIDVQGNKWFGTAFGGVCKFDGSTYINYNSSNSGLLYNYVTSIAIDSQGNKWFGAYGHGVSKFDDTTWVTYTASNSGLVNNLVNSIAIDMQGNKWFGTLGGGVSRFDGTNWITYNTNNSGLVNNYVYSIATDTQGNIWFGTGGGGVSKFDGTNWTAYDTSNSNVASDIVFSIAIDAQNNKWFGTQKEGVCKFDDTNWVTYNPSNSGLSGNSVDHIAIDANGNKWFNTYNINPNYTTTPYGINKFNGNTWTTYNVNNSGLLSNSANGIAIDAQGNRWFATTNGISELSGYPLVLHLLSFTGEAKDNTNLLHWQTADEKNNKGFEVQRSGDGKAFAAIGFVNAAKEETGTHNYNYTDTHPLSGANYYRLKMEDVNGSYEYSNIVKLESSKAMPPLFSIYPNPVSNTLHIVTSQSGNELALYDVAGRKVFSKALHERNNIIDIKALSPGIYFYEYGKEKGKLVKE